jgi:hypothetical protein
MQANENGAALRAARLKLALMFLMPALAVLLATAVYFTGIGVPQGTTNKGVLVQPARQIDELPLRTADGKAWRHDAAPRGWGMLVSGSPSCDPGCRERIHLTRQVRAALGKDTDRVHRYYLAAGGAPDGALTGFLAAEHADVQVLVTDAAALRALLGRPGDPDPVDSRAIYLVDPRGFVMMHYLPDHPGRAMVDDLRFLLKNSND